MINYLLIILGKLLSKLSQTFNLGNGSTWPGHIALTIHPNFIRDNVGLSRIQTIVVIGTNGKTTTAKLIRTVLETDGKRVIQNQSGANLLNGVASTILLNTNAFGKLDQDFAIFEIDENNLPLLLQQITPDYLVLLNLFRDQLDRYGEINTIIEKWSKAVGKLKISQTPLLKEEALIHSPAYRKNSEKVLIPRNDSKKTTLILNADDPQIAYLGKNLNPSPIFYFGINATKNHASHAADSIYCPNCGEKLQFQSVSYSHLGHWCCPKCRLRRPKPDLTDFPYFPLIGEYNQYNTLAAVLTLQQIGVDERTIIKGLKLFQPAFGRQEIIRYKNKTVILFLSKNPTSFNQSFETIKNLGARNILLILNDRIPDGCDISWIWDTELDGLDNFQHITIAGDRMYDMALRIKYEVQTQRADSKKQIDNQQARDTTSSSKPENAVSNSQSIDSEQAGNKNFQNVYDKVKTFDNLEMAIEESIKYLASDETLFILPTYSAMLEARKILTGKKIL